MRSRSISSVLAAGALTLAMVVPASAATVSEGFTLATGLTVTNIPASVTYEAVGGGDLQPGAVSEVSVIAPYISSNGTVVMSMTSTDFSGASAMSGDVREVRGVNASGGISVDGGFADWAIVSTTPNRIHVVAPDSATFDLEMRVTPPGNAAAGSYSGSVELTFSNV